MVDEESIFVLIRGDLLIRHGFAVPPSPLGKALDKQFNAPINHNLKVFRKQSGEVSPKVFAKLFSKSGKVFEGVWNVIL